MTIDAAALLALALPQLERDEGVRTEAYLDKRGIPTIGVGHTGREVHLGLVWTLDQVRAQLRADVGAVLTGLDSALAWWRGLGVTRGEVLVNIAFNAGVHGLLGFHRMIAACEADDWPTAGAEIIDSTLAPARARRLAAQMTTGAPQ